MKKTYVVFGGVREVNYFAQHELENLHYTQKFRGVFGLLHLKSERHHSSDQKIFL
jgi:hypothetical protein